MKIQDAKRSPKSPSRHHLTTLSGYIFATKARIDNRKKIVKQRYVLHMSPQYGELRPPNGWDPSGSLRHPCKFQWVSRLGSVTARHLVAGVSQILRRWTEGAIYIWQGGHHVGHWPTLFCVVMHFFRVVKVCFCCVRFRFFHTKPRDGLGEHLRNDLFCVEWDVKP